MPCCPSPYRLPLIFFLLLLPISFALAQDTHQKFSIELRSGTGASIKPGTKYFAYGPVVLHELRVGLPNRVNDYYFRRYHKPTIGFGYAYKALPYFDPIAPFHSLFVFYEVPLWNSGRLKPLIDLSAGLAYNSSSFDPKHHYLNLAIGSPVSFWANSGLGLKYATLAGWTIKGCLHLVHISNGNLFMPNPGLNAWVCSAGVQKTIGLAKRELIYRPEIPETKMWRWSFMLTSFTKKRKLEVDKRYLTLSLVVDVGWQLTPISRVGLGVDAFYDGSREWLRPLEERPHIKKIDLANYGVHVSHDFRYRQSELTTQLGAYVFSPIPSHSPAYLRFAFRQFIGANLFLNFGVKAHAGASDFMEFGVGFMR